jgi:hypothetical protein
LSEVWLLNFLRLGGIRPISGVLEFRSNSTCVLMKPFPLLAIKLGKLHAQQSMQVLLVRSCATSAQSCIRWREMQSDTCISSCNLQITDARPNFSCSKQDKETFSLTLFLALTLCWNLEALHLCPRRVAQLKLNVVHLSKWTRQNQSFEDSTFDVNMQEHFANRLFLFWFTVTNSATIPLKNSMQIFSNAASITNIGLRKILKAADAFWWAFQIVPS